MTRLASMEIRGDLSFDRVPEGMRMRWRWDVRPRGLTRLLGPLIEAIGRRQERAIWTNLKRLLEAREEQRDGA
jgi:hypothetical protein